MDIASVVGLVVCIGMVIMGIVTGDEGISALGNFMDYKSALITFGGSFASVMIFYSIKDFLNSLKAFKILIYQT